MTEPDLSAESVCPGSGQWPAEQVLVDAVYGVYPGGTCGRCGRRMALVAGYRLPEHIDGTLRHD